MRKISILKIFLILFILSSIIYSSSIKGEFLLDDKVQVVQNVFIRQIKTFPQLFTTDAFHFASFNLERNTKYYRPVQALSFAIDYRLWKLNPLGYHLTNIIIHALMGTLIFYIIFVLFDNFALAFLSSILFCTHPIHTEAVAYISGRAELLVSLFTLLSIIFYLGYIKSGKNIKYLLSLFCFVLALLSKEAGFLILVPFSIVFFGARAKVPRINLFYHFISFAGILAIYAVLRLTVLVPIIFVREEFNFLEDILNFSLVLIEYLRILIFPYPLHLFRSIAPIKVNHPYIIAPLFFIISFVFLFVVLVKKKKSILLFGLGWFSLSLIYLIRNIYKFSNDVITMEEHWIYFSSMGFFLILAYLIKSIKNKKLSYAISVSMVVIFGTLTFINSRHWNGELLFYRYNLKLIDPLISTIPRINFIYALKEKNFYEEALKEADYILSIFPYDYNLFVVQGDIFKAMKRNADAEDAYKQALKINPFCWLAYRRLKTLAEELGKPFTEETYPGFTPREAKIMSLIRLGEFKEAFQIMERELSESPSSNLYMLAGIALGQIGRYQEALVAFNVARKLDKQNSLALYNLAITYKILGQMNKSKQLMEEFERLKINNLSQKK